MNWQTEELLKKAEDIVSDDTVFTEDQSNKLKEMVSLIKAAIENESNTINPFQNH
ncbi:hypothetical protein [Desulfospira joergensenii]|uniref:hypothetical protein n=1 Tax=Desulfospira joergensenii TaxID=53329 RepID=UPI0003B6AE4B|nr:hypothetical protein [Desulfospira joergensenii]